MKKILSVDVGATFVKYGIFEDEKILLKGKFKTSNKPEETFNLIFKIAQKNKVEGISLGIPGIIDMVSGVINKPPNLPLWDGFNVKDFFSKRGFTNLEVLNDANMAVLGVWKYGEGRRCKDLVVLTLGSGVGGGVIVNGKLLLGKNFAAGELGHVIINVNGQLCRCGNRGCLEAYLGAQYFSQNAFYLSKKLNSKLAKENHLGEITPEIVYKYALTGDKGALKAFEEYAYYLAVGCVNFINIFSPEKIVFVGGISKSFHLFSRYFFDFLNNMLSYGQRVEIGVEKKEDISLWGGLVLLYDNSWK